MRNLRGLGEEAAQTTGRLSSVCPSLRTYTAHEVSDRLADLIGVVYLDEVAPLHRAFGRQNSRCRPTRIEPGYELAPRQSITSSARASSCAATSRPSALAVLRLITSSNFISC
jgi:hypothetical protein